MIEQLDIPLNSHAVFIASIIVALIVVCLIVWTAFNIFLFIGPTITKWVETKRTHQDAQSAASLKRVRKLLEILAHDVLKHRLLGLISLDQELKKSEQNQGHITKEQLDDIRDEMFRLCYGVE